MRGRKKGDGRFFMAKREGGKPILALFIHSRMAHFSCIKRTGENHASLQWKGKGKKTKIFPEGVPAIHPGGGKGAGLDPDPENVMAPTSKKGRKRGEATLGIRWSRKGRLPSIPWESHDQIRSKPRPGRRGEKKRGEDLLSPTITAPWIAMQGGNRLHGLAEKL